MEKRIRNMLGSGSPVAGWLAGWLSGENMMWLLLNIIVNRDHRYSS